MSIIFSFVDSFVFLRERIVKMRVEELDTPTLTIDLDALEENLDRYQRYYNEHGIGLRPHIKTHKTLAIAAMQMEKGAIGLTCQKVGEAEVMVSGGLAVDILIPFNIIGKRKLERLTALATQTRLTVAADSAYTVRGLADAVAGTGAQICDTRKTTPGLRAFQKYAVRCGGGANHRYSLDDAILIKDNHIAVAGSVTAAYKAAEAFSGHLVAIEIEVTNLAELEEALAAL